MQLEVQRRISTALIAVHSPLWTVERGSRNRRMAPDPREDEPHLLTGGAFTSGMARVAALNQFA